MSVTETRPPSAGERWALVPARVAAERRGMPREVLRLLRAFDGVRTLEAVCAESGLPHARTRQVIARLARLGVIAPVVDDAPARRLSPRAQAWLDGERAADPAGPAGPAGPAVRPANFSDEEERFFSSSIEHLLEDLRAP